MSDFTGRMDLIRAECPECKGDKRDPKKKKRPCPVCDASGHIGVCPKCRKPAYRGSEDASGKYRIAEDATCKCYEGILL